MTIALIDVDDFRAINEKFGHLAGDRALKVIARALQTKIRDTDFIARYTSDKFVVILLGTERKDIDIPLKKLNEIISSIPFHFKDNKVEITVSIGAAYFTENDNPVTVLEKAEQELSEAKKSGKNRFSIQ
jgi:diguanylate cyclase (GGDEF)-like protein